MIRKWSAGITALRVKTPKFWNKISKSIASSVLWIWKQNESLGNFKKKFNDPYVLITYLPWVTYMLVCNIYCLRCRTCEQHDLKFQVIQPETYYILEKCHHEMSFVIGWLAPQILYFRRPRRQHHLVDKRAWVLQSLALALSLGLHFLTYEMRGSIILTDHKRYL